MVFRAQSRIGVPVYDTWVNSSVQHDDPVRDDFPLACLRLTDYGQCDRHFRSQLLDSWTHVREVRFSLVKDDVEVAYIIFDASHTDMMSWFSQIAIIQSHWSPDILSDTGLEPVTIQGKCDSFSCRRFLIHGTYGLCRYEYFYTFVIDMAYDACNTGNQNWEIFNLTSFPVFIYAPGTGRGSLGIDRGTYDLGQEADVLSVWVKMF
ncbi:hypothetical protein EGW08_010421 [Elysia chlorotica]|uniref:Uncharacterized protein n=1 Tax=Elysia chlorotica TaxID=188477 RepID=A0A3S0ZSQ7_ELYCH|nr:hypothetical protein EGW08_010421 [Elysia chlorotica]